jgi:putative oxidoreductase
METSYIFAPSTGDVITLSAGLLIARLVLGLFMTAHGAQKLFGWFGGYGLAGTAGFFEQIGFRPGRLFVVAASVTELTSGLLVLLGFLGPIGPALMLSVLIVATISVHWQNGVFVTSNGIEHTVVFAAGAFALALTGPGLFSLDALLGLESFWAPSVAWTALAVGIAGGFANVAMRRRPTTTAGA